MQNNLEAIRAEIDDLDNRIHDLLMERANRVGAIAAEKGRRQMAVYRPAREAIIMRRLMARHQGPLSITALMRLWRELLPIMAGLQGDMSLALAGGEERGALLTDLARLHFGFLTPFRSCISPLEVIRAVRERKTTLGLLPYPDPEDGPEAWWLHWTEASDAGLAIIVRLPFVPPAAPVSFSDGGWQGSSNFPQAFVLGPISPEDTGDDRSLISLEIDRACALEEVSQLFYRCGYPAEILASRDKEAGEGRVFLLEFNGFYPQDLQPLAEAIRSVFPCEVTLRCLGAYAAPIRNIGR